MTGVVYFAIEGAPGRYFACARYGTLSDAACARNYQQAPSVAGFGRLTACLGCPVGALHAGAQAPERGDATSRGVCVRCRKGGTQRARGTGRIRLVRDGTICVSCYNREREEVRGFDAKGQRPRFAGRLFPVEVTVLAGGGPARVRLERVRDRVEAALTVLRAHEDVPDVRVAWGAPVRPGDEEA